MVYKIVISIILLSLITGVGWISAANSSTAVVSNHQYVERTNKPDIREVILKKAKAKLVEYYSSGDHRFNITARWIPNRLMQKDPASITAVELDGNVEYYTNFNVILQENNQRESIQIQLKVEVEKKLPVVVERISRGSIIGEDKIEHQWVSISRNSGDYIEKDEKLIGKTLKRTLLSGQPVRKSFISREYIIEAGEEVKVIMERKGIHVQVSGEARENGAKGDRIKIYSDETRRKYLGEVIKPGVTLWKNTL